MAITISSPGEVITQIAARMKQQRIASRLTQEELALNAGVSYGSLRLLETKGKGSFEAVVKVAFALGCEGDLDQLFSAPPPRSIDDVVKKSKPLRQRVRKPKK